MSIQSILRRFEEGYKYPEKVISTDPAGYITIPGHRQYGINREGKIVRFTGSEIENRPIKTYVSKGQWRVNLYTKDAIRDGELYDSTDATFYPVASLLMKAFGEPKPEGACIWYKDKNPLNCTFENLYWTSLSAILREKYASGAIVKPTGDRHWRTGTTHTKRTKRLMREAKKLSMDNNEITNE